MSIKIVLIISCLGGLTLTYADSNSNALATKLANPIASMVSLPLQYNYDQGIGTHKGSRSLINFQPVIPFQITEEYELITRMVMPIISQSDISAKGEDQTFIGNSLFSFFLSPSAPVDGWVLGLGVAVDAPTSTNSDIMLAQWSVGPTAIALHQKDGWTIGALANALYSVSDTNKNEVKSAYIQPFVSYTTQAAVTYTIESETTYDWVNEKTDIPINFLIGKLFKVSDIPVQISGGVRYWAQSDITQADDFGLRMALTIILAE